MFAVIAPIILCAILLAFPHLTHADLTSGLVGYWSFNGSHVTDKVYDRSGQGNNGYFQGSATSSAKVQGKLGQALNFIPANENNVNLGNPASLQITGSITLAGWVKLRSVPGAADAQIIARSSCNGGGGSCGYKLAATIDNGPLQAQFVIASTSVASDVAIRYGATTLALNTWYFITGVYDASAKKMHVYVNGTLDDGTLSGIVPPAIYLPSVNALLGSSDGGAVDTPDGLLDELRVYNRALSATEVKQLYLHGQALLKPPNNLGLIGYWPLNEGVGTKAGDFSGFGHPGTLTGTPVPSWVSGKRGGALNFDGNTDYVGAGNISSMNGLSAVTISTWIKSAGANAGGVQIVDKSACSGLDQDGPFELFYANGQQVEFGVYAAAGGVGTSGVGSSNVNDGKWHFVTGTYDGVTTAIWVDGKQENANTPFSGTLTSTSTIFANSAGYRKEIDHALERIGKIEKKIAA